MTAMVGALSNTRIEGRFSHEYGDLLVIDDVNLTLNAGEFVCVVGPSGCGKTTFSYIVSGLLMPSSGEIRIGSEVIDPKHHSVSMVFQDPALWPWRTIEQNVRVGLEVKGYPPDYMQQQVDSMLQLVGLRDFKSHYPYQLSGGMKQRAAIARAFASDSVLVVMDEPFVALDAPTREAMQRETLRVWRERKRSVVFVTHNLEEAIYLAGRIIVFSARPARVIADLTVPWPQPRDITSDECVKMQRSIRALLENQTGGTT